MDNIRSKDLTPFSNPEPHLADRSVMPAEKDVRENVIPFETAMEVPNAETRQAMLDTQTSQIPKMASSLAPYCLHHLSCHQNTLQPATGTRAKAFLMYPGMCSMNSLINASTCSSVIWKTVLMH